ncbi:MAG: SGNH/GDSL hydrolase family protein, partial [Tepidisphaeraceae bacterium]
PNRVSKQSAAPTARPRLSTSKKLLFAVVVVIGLPVVLLALGEIAGRIYIWHRYGKPDKSYGIYQSDPEFGAVHRPNSYNTNTVINNLGLRNVEDITTEKPPRTLRVYCTGGSTTFCYNLMTQDAWPSVLQDKLRKLPGHEHDQVLNAGNICFSLSHEYALAKRYVPILKPDVVIIHTGVNEFLNGDWLAKRDGVDLDKLLAEQRFGGFTKSLPQSDFFMRNSVLRKYWDYQIKQMFANQMTAEFHGPVRPDKGVHPWMIANFDHTLRQYIRFLRDNGCRVIVLRYGDDGKENWHLVEAVRVFRDRAAEIAREEGAEVCDVTDIVAKHPHRADLFISSGVHVTSEGADVYTDALLKSLTEPPPATRP